MSEGSDATRDLLSSLAGQATSVLEDPEGMLQGILNVSPAPFIIIDAQGVIQRWNAPAEETFGWTAQEAIGRSLSGTIVPARHREGYARGIARVLETDMRPLPSRRVSLTACRRDGREVPVELAVAPIPIGETVVFGAFVRDLTRRNEPASVPQEERALRAVVEQAAVGVAVVDRSGAFLRTNRVYRELVGYEDAELRSMTILDVIHPDDRPRVKAVRAELLEGRRGGYQLEKRFLRKNGETFPGRIIVSLLRDDEGGVQGTIAVCEDVRQRREATEQLRLFADRLREARESERIQISRRIHDELGQSLTALRLDLAWLETRLTDPALREKSQAMARLAEATIGRIRTLATELRPAVLDDLGLPAAIEWESQEFTRRTGIPCALDLPHGTFTLDLDRSTDLFRILQEALTNVARHAAAHHVGVRLRRLRREVQLRVDDDGRGITPDELTSHRSLGLLGMRERARLWKGQTVITAPGGGGTSVVVRIPTSRTGSSPWTG